jgi:hypothetical protein
MSEEPIINRTLLKLVLILLVAAGLGGGAYALASGGIDLPDVDLEATDGQTTELENTILEDTTIGDDSQPEVPAEPGEGPLEPFTSLGFGAALERVRGAAGPGARLTRLFINDVQTQFIVLRGDDVEALSIRADTGELSQEEASVTVSGNATLQDFAYALDAVKPSAIDRMLTAARRQSGAGDFRPTVLSLERRLPFGEKTLEWTINAQGSGRNLLYRAAADGSGVRNEGGAGTEIPEAALDAQRLNDCINEAGEDTDAIFACFDEFQ